VNRRHMFKGLEPWLIDYAEYLYIVARYNGLRPRVTSVRRSRAKQAELYRRYLAGQSRFPAAPPGRSKHEYGLAFDMPVERNAEALGALWSSWGGRWGGARDVIHFEV